MREIKFLLYLNTQEGVKRYSVDRIDYKRYGDFEITRIYYGDYYVIGDALKDGFAHLVQYTGLKDKNGKEIYEGDVVEVKWAKATDKGVVKWFSYGFYVTQMKNHSPIPLSSMSVRVEVIGNVWEDGELLND